MRKFDLFIAALTALALSPLSLVQSYQAQAQVAGPSVATARAVFEARLRRQVGDTPFIVLSFEKTDGQRANFAGVSIYRLFYSARVKFPRGHRPECVPQGNRFTGFDCGFAFGPAAGPGRIRPQPVGGVAVFQDVMGFEERESGWVAR